ncbi:MAG: hypothetical protein IKU24_04710, partial [Clostridia bacterium]|nr:hypothetical protein [Clostridia bacterium]
MTKRLISLMLALIMLLSLCMTSCANTSEEDEENETEEEVQRPNLALTIYAIMDEKTTKEGLEKVEEKISNYCVAKYKTAIDLRFFTEEEYQAGLDAMYDKFAAEAAEKLKAEQEAAAAAKSEAEYKATLTPEERIEYDQKKRLEAKKAEEEAKKKAEEEAELIEQGKDVAVVKDVQMDIIYIPDMDSYKSYIEQEQLLGLNEYLNTTQKKIKNYIYPAYLTAASVNSSVYGIPNNAPIATNETYFVVNTALSEKYGVDFDKVRSINDLEEVFAKVKAGEQGVTPIYGDFDPEGLVFYNGVDMGRTTCVFADNLLGGTTALTNTNATFNPNSTQSAFINYCATKAEYRKSGYLSDTNQNFFLSVQELTEEERMDWEKKGYTTVLYKGAPFTTEAALNNGLFGISSHCEYPERAAEILELIVTDTEFHNLFAFGIEEENYIVNADNKNVITVVDDSYSMDFYKTGNTFIGYIPDTMDVDYIEKGREKNLNAYISPFFGFEFDWTATTEEKWLTAFAEWKAYVDPLYEKLSYGTD